MEIIQDDQMQSYELAHAHVQALTNADPATVPLSWRFIHDSNKGVAAHKQEGTLPNIWHTALDYQRRGYGVFFNINLMMFGHNRENVAMVRCHVADLDSISAPANYANALCWWPRPSFAVHTSPDKHHVYWNAVPYLDNERYTLIQRKLSQKFDGDVSVIDPSRVLRCAGFLHLKNSLAPTVVGFTWLGGYQTAPEQLEQALASINIVDSSGGRRELGDPALAAPSLSLVQKALELINPNDLDRGAWLSTMAAIKQAGWNHASEPDLYALFDEWCAC